MRPRPSLTRPPVLLLEFLLSWLVVAIFVALASNAVYRMVNKVLLVQVFIGSSYLRAAAVEEFALSGSFSSTRTERALETPSMLTPQEIDAMGQVSYRQVAGNVEASGTLPHLDGQMKLSFHAAVIGQGLPFNVIWLCGERRPPPGWFEPGPIIATGLQPELLPSVCREDWLE